MTGHIWSYPQVYNLGHPALEELFDGTVVIEEKVDGSQLSFGVLEGELLIRSKGADLFLGAPQNKLFAASVETIERLFEKGQLQDGWVYRAEALRAPRHNTLVYDRAPAGNLVLFDIEVSPNRFAGPLTRTLVAQEFGIEPVPVLMHSAVPVDLETFKALLERVSVLGGQKVEGVVVKNYERFGRDQKVLMGKYVSEEFKEVHRGAWKTGNPVQGDVIERIVMSLRTPARWQKAVQHLAEAGVLEGSPRDIGPLIQEVKQDTLDEEADFIARLLLDWALPKVERGITGGLPEWYKAQLLEHQFEEPQEFDIGGEG